MEDVLETLVLYSVGTESKEGDKGESVFGIRVCIYIYM